MAEDDSYFRLRIPHSLKAKVEQSATDNRRSMNAEIIARLEVSYEFEPLAQPQLDVLGELIERLKRLEERVEKEGG